MPVFPLVAPVASVARDGMTAYGRLAAQLWVRIANREWTAGARLPTVVQLAKEYGVAAVTVRGALGILSAQGLVHTKQGRGTIVNGPGDQPLSLGESYFGAWLVGPAESARVIAKNGNARLPASLADGAACLESYIHLRRLHRAREKPVCIVDFYIAPEPYASLPVGLDDQFKIGLLLMTQANPRPVQGRQVTTVSLAGPEEADLLGIAVGMPLVLVERRFIDGAGAVLGAGLHRYPGSVFRQVIDQPISEILRDMDAWLPSDRSRETGKPNDHSDQSVKQSRSTL